MDTTTSNVQELRRHRNNLVIIGTGFIAFGVWSIVKAILTCTLQFSQIQETLASTSAELSPSVVIGIALALVLIDLLIRLYVGLSARAEGRGKHKSVCYLVVAVIMMVVSVALVILIIVGLASPGKLDASIADIVITVVIEATSVFVLAQMVRSALMVKRLSKAVEQEADHAG